MADSCKIFSSSSWALKVSAVLLAMALIVQCVAIGIHYWYGLFTFSYYVPSWLLQALEVTGLIGIIIAGFMVLKQVFCTQSIAIKIWGIYLMFCSGFCILAGVALYGELILFYLVYAYGLCFVASMILCFVCAIFLIQDRRISTRRAQTTGQIHYASQEQIIQRPKAQVVFAHSRRLACPLTYATQYHTESCLTPVVCRPSTLLSRCTTRDTMRNITTRRAKRHATRSNNRRMTGRAERRSTRDTTGVFIL